VSAAKSSSSGGGSHAQIASSTVTDERERLGPRLLALAALWSLLCGLLLALSFVVVAVVAFAALLLVGLVAGAVLLQRRLELGYRVSAGLISAGQAAQRRRPRIPRPAVRQPLRRLAIRTRDAASTAPGRGSALLAAGVRTYAVAVYWVSGRMSRILAGNSRLGTLRSRKALELNELGTQLRRQGEHEQAAEQHRVALAIARDLGDVHAEALTLNNLALALAQGGAETEAVRHLEQALVVLRELGDEKHEGQVIANLGIVYRRQGNSEEAVSLLHEALDKLPPESWAYRQVEKELRRAS
jgi:tetratricopeptide (TPR) repeat protein